MEKQDLEKVLKWWKNYPTKIGNVGLGLKVLGLLKKMLFGWFKKGLMMEIALGDVVPSFGWLRRWDAKDAYGKNNIVNPVAQLVLGS